MPRVEPTKKNLGRHFRKTMSPPEALLWTHLRSKKIGFHVRRQVNVGAYYLDFYIEPAKLAIEVDGFHHEASVERDTLRDEFLESIGIHVIRIDAAEIYKNLNGILETIYNVSCERSGQQPLE